MAGRPLVLPGGMEVNMADPSPDAQLLAGGLQEIVYLLGGNPNNGNPGVIQMLQGVQVQLDTLIRMEAHETPRAEIKRRIEKADFAADQRIEEAKQAREAMEAEEAAARAADNGFSALEDDDQPPVGVTEEPADPHDDGHDIGGEG